VALRTESKIVSGGLGQHGAERCNDSVAKSGMQ